MVPCSVTKLNTVDPVQQLHVAEARGIVFNGDNLNIILPSVIRIFAKS